MRDIADIRASDLKVCFSKYKAIILSVQNRIRMTSEKSAIEGIAPVFSMQIEVVRRS